MSEGEPATVGPAARVTALFDLTGRVALVTGAARGIGAEIARTLAAAGATVIVGDRDGDAGRVVATEVGGGFEPLDVTDTTSVDGVIDGIAASHGRLDILVNNAGIVRNEPAESMSDEDWLAQFAVNSDGVFRCSRAAARHMLGRGAGSIVTIASMSGLIANHPQPQAAYNASKAAVILLTRSLASEWAGRGVRVNAVAPGYVATDLTMRGMSNPVWRDAWLAAIPMGRLATPDEISPAVLYLASDAASYVTGSVLVVDGGYTAR